MVGLLYGISKRRCKIDTCELECISPYLILSFPVFYHISLCVVFYKFQSECDVESLMYLTPWFMSVYTSLPCWDTVLAIWDLLLLHGKLE